MSENPVPPSLGISDGVMAFAGGIGFVVRTPRMWPYAMVPILMMMVVLTLVAVLFIWGGVSLTHVIVGDPEGFWGKAFGWVLTVIFALVSLLIAVLASLALAQPLSCFALEAIAHAHERELTGRAPSKPRFVVSLLLELRFLLLTFSVGLPILALLFAIGLFFPPAVLVTMPLKFLVCSWLLAWDFLDYPMGLRGMPLRERLRWVWRNFDAFSAFGSSWATLAIIPGVVLILLPMGVAGATQLVVEDDRRTNPEPEPEPALVDAPET